MAQPSVNWTPSIAPSGMAYYGSKGKKFRSLQQHVLITILADQKLHVVNLADGQFTQTHVFPELAQRLRDVVLTHDGNIAILTDGKNAELKLISAY